MHYRFRLLFSSSFASFSPFSYFLPLVFGLLYASCHFGTFDLEVHLTGTKDHPVVFHGSRVSVQFGNNTPEPPQPLTDDGHAVFPKLSRGLLHDTIRLTYLATNGRPYRVIRQVFFTAADRQQIDFTVELVPDTTHVQFSLKNKAGLIVGALVKIDDKITIESNDVGLVDVFVPKTAGSTVHMVVEKDGKVLLDRQFVLTDEYSRVYVNE